MGQRDGNPVLLVAQPNGLGKVHLLDNFGRQRLGQGNHPVFAALGPEEKETGFFQVNVFDTQIEGFGDTQAAAINQAGDEIGGIAGAILNSFEQGLSFGDGRCMAQAGGPSGAEGVHILQRLTENFLVKEEHGIEGLILAVSGQIAVAGQMSKEAFQFFLTGK